MIFGTGCWAPERNAPGPRQSPAEIASKPNSSSTGITLVPNPNAGSPVVASNQELDDEERRPPYTAWTLIDNVSVIGPNGAAILDIANRGVRVDVLSISGQYAQIQCSGCNKPNKNHAGWVALTSIASAWDIPPDTALLAMTSLRQKWIKGQDLPEVFENKRDLCMLVDAGFTLEEGKAAWTENGGRLEMIKEENEWILLEAEPPPDTSDSTWRCDIQYPK